MDALRVEVERIAATRSLAGLPSTRLAAGSLSDLAHVNRVQGLTLGFGGQLGSANSRFSLRPSLSYGASDERLGGSLSATWSTGATQLSLRGSRSVSDFSDLPVIAPLVNSILAQEGGNDHGDYVLLHWIGAGLRQSIGGRTSAGLDIGIEESRSVATTASPARGTYRSNPALGSGTFRIARLSLERSSGGIALRRDLRGKLSLEGGTGTDNYVRATAVADFSLRLGTGELLTRGYFGAATDATPPHRTFVLGGRGTLPGERFRAYGGRMAGLVHVEWRVEVPVPAVSLGSFASTGTRATLAPFVALGYAGRPLGGLPWGASDGVRPVAGLAVEWFMRLIRVELGVGLRSGEVGVTVDVNRDWWGLL
jgi:hypothetical protein